MDLKKQTYNCSNIRAQTALNKNTGEVRSLRMNSFHLRQ